MFFIPLGIVCGAEISMQTFFLRNLIPVTFGTLDALWFGSEADCCFSR